MTLALAVSLACEFLARAAARARLPGRSTRRCTSWRRTCSAPRSTRYTIVRGDLTEYRGTVIVEGGPNWRFSVVPTGALPYFEVPREFFDAFDGVRP